MAKSSRKAKAVEAPEEEASLSETATAPNKEEIFLMGLLILAFGFILMGIVINWYILYDRYDTPFMMVVQKDPNKTVKALVDGGTASAGGGDTEDGTDDADDAADAGGGGGDSGDDE